MIPKKVKKDINPYPGPELSDRRKELSQFISKDGTYLPKSILHEDLDKGMLDFVTNEISITSEGVKVPVINKILTLQKWAEYTTTWQFTDDNKNVDPPFIAVIRHPDPKYGTNPSLQYTIPNRKNNYIYSVIPTWDGTRKGADVYKIPQPVPIDITYDIIIVANRLREVNLFNKEILQKFSSRQAYTFVKGHYIPIVNQEIVDESQKDLEKRKFYLTKYTFLMMGFLIDEEEFEVTPAISRELFFFEVDSTKKVKTKPFKEIINKDKVYLKINFAITASSSTYTFEYPVDIDVESKENVSSYSLSVNSIDTTLPVLINKNDTLTIDIVKSYSGTSFINFVGRIKI